jgi:hypothetical protein
MVSKNKIPALVLIVLYSCPGGGLEVFLLCRSATVAVNLKRMCCEGKKPTYEILKKAPTRLIKKDKKIITAGDDPVKLRDAWRNRQREWLNCEGRRVKERNLSRSAGLYLWDQMQVHKNKNIQEILDVFYDTLKKIEQAYPEAPEFPFLKEDRLLRSWITATDLCITHYKFLPVH